MKGHPYNAAYIPLKFGDVLLGVMEIINYKENIDDNLRLLTLFCDNLASGLMLYEIKLSQEAKMKAAEVENPYEEAGKTLDHLIKLLEAQAY